MLWYVVAAEALIFAALFTATVFFAYGGDRKYSPAAIYNYPPDIREEYFKTHKRVEASAASKSVIAAKGLGVVSFTCVLSLCAYFAGAKTFWQGFITAFALMLWIGAYDTFFLDWVLFAKLPAFRLEGTEHMDKAYRQKWFHLKGMLFPGVVFALVPAALSGLFIAFIK